jgi:hypothetical protein
VFRRTRVLTAAAVVLAVLPVSAGAQEPFEKVTPTADRFDAMAFPRGVRSIGMGVTGAADATDPANVYYNPSVLACGTGIGLTAGTNNWTSGFDFYDVGVSAAYQTKSASGRRWHAGAGIRYVEMDFDGANDAYPSALGIPPPADAFDDWYLASTVAGGYSPGNFDFGLGFAVKYLDAGQVPGVDFSSWSFDVGALARYTYRRTDGLDVVASAGISGLSLGADESGPEAIAPVEQRRAGLSVRVEAKGEQEAGEPDSREFSILSISLNGELVDFVDYQQGLGSGIGMEMSLVNIMSIRYGYADKQYAFGYGQTFGGALGYGFGRVYVRVDLAMAFETDLNKNISAVGFFLDVDV